LPEGAWLDPAAAAQRFDVDTVVLDVDGVLVDVRASFREAVRETVVRVQREMHVAAPWRPSHADINAFKRCGGFNDDIDISIALAALGAAHRGDHAAAVAGDVERAGGGLRALRQVAPDLPRIEGRRVLHHFDQLYWGAGATVRVEDGHTIPVPASDGMIHRERMLVPPDYPRALRQVGARCVACISGRTPRELDAALRALGWHDGDLDAVVTGDMVRKPDPACLEPVIAACAPRAMVYVGDVRDDWELVRRHRDERADTPPARCILVGDDADMQPYRALGVQATARRALDVPAILQAWR
jgi:HAD superfamily hydrolase (TIGR01548 family)